MQDLKALEGKSLAELREIAKALGLKNIMAKKKRELMESIAGNAADGGGMPAQEDDRQALLTLTVIAEQRVRKQMGAVLFALWWKQF